MPDKEYSIERLSADNIADLYRLFQGVYNRKQEENYFHKKYDTAYTGVQYIGHIAYTNSHIPIAFYGVAPCFLKHNNEQILSAQSTDTMTHPAYRFKGMFMELSELCFQLCRQHNILLLFGFPNQNSYHGALKLGWIMTGSMDYFTINAASYSLESLCSKFWLTSIIYKAYCKAILKKYQSGEKGLTNQLIDEGFIGINRNEEYLNYRTYNKTEVLQFGASKVWLKIKHGLAIGDIHLDKKEDFDALLESLVQLCRKLGLKEMSFHTSKGTFLHQLFSSRFKTNPSFPTFFQNFGMDIPLEDIKFTLADIDIF